MTWQLPKAVVLSCFNSTYVCNGLTDEPTSDCARHFFLHFSQVRKLSVCTEIEIPHRVSVWIVAFMPLAHRPSPIAGTWIGIWSARARHRSREEQHEHTSRAAIFFFAKFIGHLAMCQRSTTKITNKLHVASCGPCRRKPRYKDENKQCCIAKRKRKLLMTERRWPMWLMRTITG